MQDMMGVIAPKSDQINADDMIGGDMVIKITGVKIKPGEDQPVSIQFEGSKKVYRPCKSMSRVIVAVWGADTSLYVGRSMKLYRDPDVQWGGLKVGGIRIREMSHMDGDRPMTMALTEKRGARKPFVVRPLSISPEPDQPISKDQAAALAESAARRGKERFIEWFNSPQGKQCRALGVLDMDHLKQLCEQADRAISEDPFGLPPLQDDPSPSPEEIARAQAAAEAEIERRNREAEAQ